MSNSFATPWTVASSSVHEIFQARILVRAKILEWLPFPSLGDLPDPGIKPVSLHRQVDSLQLSYQRSPLLHYIPETNTMIMSTKHHFTKKKKIVLSLPLNVDFRRHFQQPIWLANSKKSIFL